MIFLVILVIEKTNCMYKNKEKVVGFTAII